MLRLGKFIVQLEINCSIAPHERTKGTLNIAVSSLVIPLEPKGWNFLWAPYKGFFVWDKKFTFF